MPKSKSRSAPQAAGALARPPWLAFVLIALGSATAGAICTYLVLQPGLQRPAHPTIPAAPPGTVLSVPPPELTAGVSPAQADRNLGNFFYDQSDWPQAISHYESAIREGSDDADIHTDLGNAYQFSGRPDDALAQYNTAQRLNPNHEFSLFNQGGLFMERLNQPQRAVEIWNEYLRRFPQGQNVAAARQLIAQAQARLTGAAAPLPVNAAAATTAPASTTAPSTTPAAPSNADVERLLRLVPPAAPPGKP